MHVREPARAARLAATLPVSYLAFDVLRCAAGGALATPYTGRRRMLESLELGAARRHVPPSFDDGPATVAASREHALEGVVAKRTGSHYQPGLRSPDWVKVKLEESCEFVVGGWRPGKRALGALLSASRPTVGLTFCGRVGGGISGAAERALLDALRDLATPQSPFTDAVPRRGRPRRVLGGAHARGRGEVQPPYLRRHDCGSPVSCASGPTCTLQT